MSRARAATRSAVTLASGLSLAIVPASTLAIAGALFEVAEQGVIAVMIMVSTFSAQLLVGGIVESRLATVGTSRHVRVPRWLGIIGVIAALVAALTPPSAIVFAITLPLMLGALEVARAVSIAERLDTREWWAALSVGGGATLGVVAALAGASWAYAPLALGVALATILRLAPVSHEATPANTTTRRWILADTGITGIIYPVMNALVLALLGPAESVQFTAIATVSGALAIPLNFLRARLLKEHSPLDIAVTFGAVIAAALAILLADVWGLFALLFGDAWGASPLLGALAIACVWRAASLATTIPFASLRREGAVALVTVLRAAVSGMTLGLALGGVAWGTILAVFTALLIAEALSAVVYALAWRRVSRPPHPLLERP